MSNLELAAAAWSAVRNPDDAPWNVLPMGIKAKLADLAGKYRGGAKVAEGDYPPEGFAEKVAELASRQEFSVGGDGDGSPPELVSEGVGEVQTAPKGLNEVVGDRTLVGVTTEDELRGSDVSVGDPVVFIDSPSRPQPSKFSGVEHEDTHIPSPIPEDVDPLRTDLAEPLENNK